MKSPCGPALVLPRNCLDAKDVGESRWLSEVERRACLDVPSVFSQEFLTLFKEDRIHFLQIVIGCDHPFAIVMGVRSFGGGICRAC